RRCRGEPHVNDKRAAVPGEPRPVLIRQILALPRNEAHGARVGAVGEWEARLGGASRRRGDARDDLAIDARFARRVKLLAPAPENEGVAALQANHLFAGARLAYEQIVDLVLPHRVTAALFSDADPFHFRRDQGEHVIADEAVMNDQIGAAEQPRGAQRPQAGIAGAGADEPPLACMKRSLFHAALMSGGRPDGKAGFFDAGEGKIAPTIVGKRRPAAGCRRTGARRRLWIMSVTKAGYRKPLRINGGLPSSVSRNPTPIEARSASLSLLATG